jgi:hypothetical protein
LLVSFADIHDPAAAGRGDVSEGGCVLFKIAIQPHVFDEFVPFGWDVTCHR